VVRLDDRLARHAEQRELLLDAAGLDTTIADLLRGL
jgi:hypothetical protein